MATEKRKYTFSEQSNSFKRSRHSRNGAIGDQPHIDPFTGQRNAFPGLDDNASTLSDNEDGELDETERETREALKYLKSVRTEAAGIPDLLVVPKAARNKAAQTNLANGGSDKIDNTDDQTNYNGYNDPDLDEANSYEDGEEEDTRGFYFDGAYTAYPQMGPSLPPSHQQTNSRLITAQAFYHASLLRRYTINRHALSLVPPSGAHTNMESTENPTYVDYSQPKHKERKRWFGMVMSLDPKRAEVAYLDNEDALWILESVGMMLKKMVYQGDEEAWKRIGAWVWALLGRVAECETMGSEEVAILRHLGKTTARIVKELAKGTYGKIPNNEPPGQQDTEDEDDGEAYTDAVQGDEEDEDYEDCEDDEDDDGWNENRTSDVAGEVDWEEERDEASHVTSRRTQQPRRRNSSSSVEDGLIDTHNPNETKIGHDGPGKANKIVSVSYTSSHARRRNSSSSIESGLSHFHASATGASNLNHLPKAVVTSIDNERKPASFPTDLSHDAQQERLGFGAPDAITSPSVPVDVVDNSDAAPKSVVQLLPVPDPIRTVAPKRLREATDGMFATFDVILTVVGESYRQQDLLWARDMLWDFHEGRPS